MRQSRGGVDVRPIYSACMDDTGKPRMSATDAAAVLDSPFSLYCRYHADPARMDPPDPFLETLSIKGKEHESDILESDYPDMERVLYDTPEEGFMEALRRMAGGTEALSNFPMFWLPAGMHGYTDILERRGGASAFGQHHYTVREIKVAKHIRKRHIIQAAFYAMMLGHVQRRPPELFRITNGDGETAEYRYGEHEGLLLECMEMAGRIRGGWMPPAVYGSGAPPWSNYCNQTAIANNDVSLIPGVGPGMRAKMADAGFGTVRDVAASSEAGLRRIGGVGSKTAAAYLGAARAISGGECVRKGGAIDLPDRTTEIFLDLEGLGDMSDGTMSDYLIGALVRRGGAETYRPFVAEHKREDTMLEQFLDFVDGQEDYVMYHWHHYERTHLRSMLERYGMEGGRILEPDVMVDLYPVATNAFAFPTYTNSIKDIAKWMGFRWRHGNVGATSSIELEASIFGSA